MAVLVRYSGLLAAVAELSKVYTGRSQHVSGNASAVDVLQECVDVLT